MKKIKNKDQIVCVGALITGNLIFGLVPTLQKITFPYGGSGLLTGFYSSLLALFSLAFMAHESKVSLIPERAIFRKLLILAGASACTTLLLWSSYSFIPVGVATTLHFVYPMLIAAAMTLFFGEHFSLGNGIALFLATCGVVLIGVADMSQASVTGVVLALVSGGFWAFYIIYLQRSGLSDLNTSLVNFYIALMNMIMSLAACLFAGQLKTYTIWWAWLIIVLVSILHRVIGYGLFQLGMRKVQPVSAGILCTFEPASALVFGIIILHESVTAKQVGGLVCILSAVLVNLGANYRNAGKKRKKRQAGN